MKRRELLLAGVAAALPARALAQRKPVKIGALLPRPPAQSNYAPALLKRLDELGYRDGAGMTFVYRATDAVERLPAMARELAGEKCDLFVAFGAPGARALRDLRSRVPTVFLSIEGDPVRAGIVTSLRQPEGNITGVFIPAEELVAKRIEILREILALRRLLVLSDPGSKNLLAKARSVSEPAGIRIIAAEFERVPYDYAGAFEHAGSEQAQAFMTTGGPRFSTDTPAIVALMLKHRLPGIGFVVQHVEAGMLMSLSSNQQKAARRTAELAVQVLKGARPESIPVEQADEFELAINSSTAKALGVKIPESVLARATKII